MPRRFAPTALALAALAAGPAVGQEPLRWKFAEGDTHRYELNQVRVNAANVQGQEVKTSTTQTLEMTWEVLGVEPDGSARLAQTVDRVVIGLEAPFATFAYDSADEAAPAGPAATLKPVIDALVGTRVVLVMTARGEVKEVEVPEEMVERLKAAGPAGEALQNFASAEGINGLIGQSTLVLPEGPVAEDDSWTREVELPTPQGTMKLTSTYTLDGVEGDVTTIGLGLKVDAFEAEPDAPFRMSVEDQEGTGSYAFDAAAGLLRSSEVKQRLTFLINVMDQEFTSIADSTATFSLKEE